LSDYKNKAIPHDFAADHEGIWLIATKNILEPGIQFQEFYRNIPDKKIL